MRELLACACICAACGSSKPIAGDGDDAPGTDGPTSVIDAPAAIVDNDMDGLDDAYEQKLANDYMPFISLAPDDGCTRDGLLVRVRPHPADPTKIFILYDHLFESDCGLTGHIGDDEVFGVAVDPSIPAPGGILAIKAASHQNTPCERVTQCTTCSNDSRSACDMAPIGGVMYPVVYASKDKHGQYATKGSCGFGTCFDSCTLNTTADHPPVVNAGEPAHHLVDNLTTQGFITTANGWTKPELMNFNPWIGGKFGGAGDVSMDLVDATFEAGVCP